MPPIRHQSDTGGVTVTLDRHDYAELSTAEVPAREAFAFWREMICATFVKLSADPVQADHRFTGRIEHLPVGDLELSSVVAGSQHVRRTRSLIAHSNDEYLLTSIQLSGRGRVEQDGRIALLSIGDMAFYDSTRPYTLHFDDPFHQLVVQVPKRELPLRDTRALTARTLGRRGPGEVVPAFFTALARAAKDSPEQSTVMLPQAVGLLTAAAAHAGRLEPSPDAVRSLLRERVLDFLRHNLADPRLNTTAIADACRMSRRTLYRLLGDGDGVAAELRRMRIEHAKALLLAEPLRPVGAVGRACGFDSESGFHRAFRSATGVTPGAYRQIGQVGTSGQ